MYRDDAGRFGWKDLVNGVKKAVKTVAKAVDKYIVQPVVKAVKYVANAVGNFVSNVFHSAQQTYNQAVSYASQGVNYISNQVQQGYNQAVEWAATKAAQAQAAYQQAVAIAQETRAKAEARIRKMCEGASAVWDGVGKALDQVIKGSYSKNSSTGGTIAEIIVGSISVIGDLGDVRDAVHSVQTGNWWEVGASGLGLLPIVGGVVKEGVQSTIKEGAQAAAKEVVQSAGKETAQNAAKKVEWPTNDSQLDHIFRKAEGHFDTDTPMNRKLIEEAINDKYYAGLKPADLSGKTKEYLRDMPDGSQVWVQVRDGKIQDAGLNRSGGVR